jgi:hypothetical protein
LATVLEILFLLLIASGLTIGIRMLYLTYKLHTLWEKEKTTPWWRMQPHDAFEPAMSEEFKATRRRMHKSVLIFFAFLAVGGWRVACSIRARIRHPPQDALALGFVMSSRPIPPQFPNRKKHSQTMAACGTHSPFAALPRFRPTSAVMVGRPARELLTTADILTASLPERSDAVPRAQSRKGKRSRWRRTPLDEELSGLWPSDLLRRQLYS